ncbi:oligogalacturonate lyase family protein [Formosa sp. 4Alg 33]|uniref:oligogalacturonate lyase family protein n=1 Tax=Formosa sp. 4Alg 33 TaxID=3382189 RepID=UPI003D9C01BB
MKKNALYYLLIFVLIFSFSCKQNIKQDKPIENGGLETAYPILETGGKDSMPDVWIDKDTHHKIKKLTDRAGTNRSFYFHNNPFLPTADGKETLMVFYGSNGKDKQIYTVNLNTKDTQQITTKSGHKFGEILGVKTRKVYYTMSDSIFATSIDTKTDEFIYTFPDSIKGSAITLNSTENKLAGKVITKKEEKLLLAKLGNKESFEKIYEAKSERSLVLIDLESKTMYPFYTENAWLNHLQFSPTNSDLLMYCHEGPWHKVDRIWNINTQNSELKKIHTRTVNREIAGHEFFSPDGKTIWFDLQIPRGETFYLAGKNITTGKETRYSLKRNEWSIHYNIAPDQKTFAGDGGDESQVAHAKDGKWLYHLTPVQDTLVSEKLVNMKHHNYDLEPNVHFSPDGEWIIFRANFEGDTQIYAVELQKSNI